MKKSFEHNPILSLNSIHETVQIEKIQVHSYATHTHTYHELLFYEPFPGYIKVENMRMEVTAPTIVLVTVASFHSTTVSAATNATCTKISFPSDAVNTCFSSKLFSPIVWSKLSKDSFVLQVLAKLAKESHNEERKKVILNMLLLELCDKGEQIKTEDRLHVKELVLKTIEKANESFTEQLSLKSIASDLNVTEQYLSTLFSKHLSVSFSKYIVDLRLRYAKGLLFNNSLSVTDICYLCGFRNLSHFIRSFTKKYNMSPSKLRKLILGKTDFP